MNLCHFPSIQVLKELFKQLPSLRFDKALEVAAGDGQLTKDLLRLEFREIDCFDQCPTSVKKLELL